MGAVDVVLLNEPPAGLCMRDGSVSNVFAELPHDKLHLLLCELLTASAGWQTRGGGPLYHLQRPVPRNRLLPGLGGLVVPALRLPRVAHQLSHLLLAFLVQVLGCRRSSLVPLLAGSGQGESQLGPQLLHAAGEVVQLPPFHVGESQPPRGQAGADVLNVRPEPFAQLVLVVSDEGVEQLVERLAAEGTARPQQSLLAALTELFQFCPVSLSGLLASRKSSS